MRITDLFEKAEKPAFSFKHLPKFLKAAQAKLADIEQKKENFTGQYNPSNPNEQRLAKEARAQWADMEDGELWVVALCTQCAVESGNFSQREENMKYSARRLRQVFPNISKEKAKELADAGDQAIANHIYDKKSLGNTMAGDGWLFRGRGWIQLTGRYNYTKVGDDIGVNLVANPDLAADDEYINKIAINYFETRVIGKADPFDVEAVTSKVNSAREGLTDRINKFEKAVSQVTNNTGSTA